MKKKMMMKFYIACLTCIFVFGGCSNKNAVISYQESNNKITTITFFGNKYEPENVTVIEKIISGFMKENPDIRVSYESLKGNKYYEALEKRMEAGEGDDVIMVNHDILLKLQSKGQLAELSELSSISNFTDQMLNQMESEGKFYWVPTTVSAFGLYCNMSLLQKHSREVPQNLQEWKDTCDYFLKQGITPIIANNDISLKTLAIGKGFYSTYQKGAQKDVFKRLNEGEEKLSMYLQPGFAVAKEFIDKGYIDAKKALQTQKTSDDLEEFVKGKSPFMLTGAWAAGRVDEMNPDFEFNVQPIPAMEDGSLLVVNPDTRLSVNADSEHLDAAMKFIEYFTQSENIQKFAEQQSSFSPLKDGNSSRVKAIRPLISAYSSGRTVIGTDALLDLPIWNLTAEASQKLLSGEGLDKVMTSMDQKADEERRISG